MNDDDLFTYMLYTLALDLMQHPYQFRNTSAAAPVGGWTSPLDFSGRQGGPMRDALIAMQQGAIARRANTQPTTTMPRVPIQRTQGPTNTIGRAPVRYRPDPTPRTPQYPLPEGEMDPRLGYEGMLRSGRVTRDRGPRDAGTSGKQRTH